MTKFGTVFLALLGASTVWGVARGGIVDRAREHLTVARNARLTALAGAVVYILVVAIVATVYDIQGFLAEHYLIGFLLIPPVVLKVGSTGYRFVRYYVGDRSYRLAGAPPPVFRFVVAPLLVVSTVLVLATGVELWLFGLRFGSDWMQAHTVAAVVMLIAVAAHLVAHARRSAEVMWTDAAARTRDAASGRSLVLASLVFGVVLAVASLFYPSPFPPSAAGG